MKSALILAVCVLLVVAAPSMTAAQDDDIKKMRDEEPIENDPSDMKDIEETSDPMAAAEAKEEPLEIYQEEQPEDAFDVMTLDPAGSPVFGPGGGKYPVGQELQIFTMQNGASVHVTFDGSDPTNATGTFKSPHVFDKIGEYTVRARCSAENYRDSAIIEFVYLIQESAATPRVKAFALEEQAFNTSDATATYLGRFQEGVKLVFETDTPHAKFYFTRSKKGEESVEPSIESHNTPDELVISDNGLHTLRVKALSDNTFMSEETLITVRVYPRPPRPAFHLRSRKGLMSDMDVAYYKMADRHKDEVLRPVDLLDFIALVLNPDVGKCVDCRLSKDEQEVLKEETERLKYLEGLHVDDDMKLYHGFLTRGSCFDFIRTLNQKMYRAREKKKLDENGAKEL